MPRPCLYSLGLVSTGLLGFKKGSLALAATSSYCFALKGGINYSFTFGRGSGAGATKRHACLWQKASLQRIVFLQALVLT